MKIYGKYYYNKDGVDTVVLFDDVTNMPLEPDVQITLSVEDIQNMFEQAYNRKGKSDTFNN
ncbi:hypothetical protein KW823_00505 [Enterobacter quasiroggenkampii]|nr:hypothetical protein [Enterobacter quasiroggenkampii]